MPETQGLHDSHVNPEGVDLALGEGRLADARRLFFTLLRRAGCGAGQETPQEPDLGSGAFCGRWPDILAGLADGAYRATLAKDGRLRLPTPVVKCLRGGRGCSEVGCVVTDTLLGVTAIWAPEFLSQFVDESVGLFFSEGDAEAVSFFRSAYFGQEFRELGSRARVALPRRVRQGLGQDGAPLELLVYSPGLIVVKPLHD